MRRKDGKEKEIKDYKMDTMREKQSQESNKEACFHTGQNLVMGDTD